MLEGVEITFCFLQEKKATPFFVEYTNQVLCNQLYKKQDIPLPNSLCKLFANGQVQLLVVSTFKDLLDKKKLRFFQKSLEELAQNHEIVEVICENQIIYFDCWYISEAKILKPRINIGLFTSYSPFQYLCFQGPLDSNMLSKNFLPSHLKINQVIFKKNSSLSKKNSNKIAVVLFIGIFLILAFCKKKKTDPLRRTLLE